MFSSVPNKRPGTLIRHTSMENSFSALSVLSDAHVLPSTFIRHTRVLIQGRHFAKFFSSAVHTAKPDDDS